ncbi:hypothetical protein SPBR_04066 [Sporothrix brasiliensis 5110]|uniref:Zn(2)-C6 fungal-type domain-containing protein n=1 Tax=Sporothrix brasiliensis 5110 TaxID=1398154 RepID=A0A0C2IX33_9PEZI|nr:uncharacterized protein SPBR_04066 [Sporothrix brasiliensis 5110]KIH93656.1 hypothetical protein SPBR_04066 [Sporothrix brasiliensis 5110]
MPPSVQPQQPAQQSESTTSQHPQKKRIRAVVACSHCRSKRSKCDGIPGQRTCAQCQQRGIACEMSDGKRNRGHYKPQAEALAKRVRLLEEALAEARAANHALLRQQQLNHGQRRSHSYSRSHNQPPHVQQFSAWEQMDLEMDDGASVAPLSIFAMPNDADIDAYSTMLSVANNNNNTATNTTTMAKSQVPPSSMPPPPAHNFYMPNTVYAPSYTSSYTSSHMVNQSASNVILGGGRERALSHPSQAPSCAPSHAQILAPSHEQGQGHDHSISLPRATVERTAPAATTAAVAATFAAAVAAAPFPTVRPRAACCDNLGLSPPLVDYLLGLFFHRYQMMMKFVSQQDFMTLHQTSNGSRPKSADNDFYDSIDDDPSSGPVHRKDCCHKHRSALFLAMLAAGLRYSTRPDVTDRFLRPDGENRLATAARRAVETDVGRPTLATVQTVLILCEVETSLDDQMTGYMYSCLASKLILEMGLDLGAASSSRALTAEETAIRHWLIWAASVHDQFWAVFLRRPLAIKNLTLQLSRLAWQFAVGGTSSSSTMPSSDASSVAGHGEDDLRAPSSFEDEVNDDLMDLMELARQMTDELYGAGSPFQNRPAAAVAAEAEAAAATAAAAAAASTSSAAELPYDGGGLPHAYHQHAAQRHAHSQRPDVASLDARLNQWFNSLSERVRQGPVRGHDCYHFLFVLHLHFNATKIIVHRTRAFPPQKTRGAPSGYPLPSPNMPSPSRRASNGRHHAHPHNHNPPGDYAAAASMATLGHASICMAKLFETFRRREDIRTLQCTGVQWAAMASEALTWYIETLPMDGAIEAVAHLQSLRRTLKDMTRTFLPAVYPYGRTNRALLQFQRRIDGAESPPPVAVKGKRGGPAQPAQATPLQTSAPPPPAFETVMASQAYARQDTQQSTQQSMQQSMHQDLHHAVFHRLDETASTVPSVPDLSTADTTVSTGAGPQAQHAPPSLFEADGRVSVVSLEAVKELEQRPPLQLTQHEQQPHPTIGGMPAAGTWSDQDPWDWDDLLERG